MLTFKKLQVGQLLLGVIKKVSDEELIVSLPNYLTGFVKAKDVSETFRSQQIKGTKISLKQYYKAREYIQCIILGLVDPENPGRRYIELSINPHKVNSSLSKRDFEYRQLVMAEVVSQEDRGSVVHFGVEGSDFVGFIKQDNFLAGKSFLCSTLPQRASSQRAIQVEPVLNIFETSPVQDNLLYSCMIRPGIQVNAVKKSSGKYNEFCFGDGYSGSLINKLDVHHHDSKAVVMSCTFNENLFYLSSSVGSRHCKQELLGAHVEDASIIQIDQKAGLWLKSDQHDANFFVHISRISDLRVDRIEFKEKSNVHLRVLDWDPLTGHYIATIKPSHLSAKAVLIGQLKPGEATSGIVEKVETFGLLVAINDSFRALCPISHLTETEAESAGSKYSVGQRYKFRILEVNAETRRILLTRKKGLLQSQLPPLSDLSQVNLGDVYDGFVVSLQSYGVVVKFYGSAKGLVRPQELRKAGMDNQDLFIGQVVRCRVLDYDAASGKLHLTICKEGDSLNENALLESKLEPVKTKPTSRKEQRLQIQNEKPTLINIDKQDKSCSGLGNGTLDSALPSIRSLETSHVMMDDRKDESLTLPLDLPSTTGLLNITECYEKELLGNQNSSALWIQYAAALIKLSETDLVRKVFERAIKTIDSRHEKERLNIWIAYLNFENMFGNSISSRAVLDRALVYNDPKVVSLKWCQILSESGKVQDALHAHELTVKRFRQSCKMWIALIAHHFHLKSSIPARKAFTQALAALPKRKHMKISCKLAQLEYKQGDRERGRTTFEGLLSDVPKRLDIWLVYISLEESSMDDGGSYIRRLFERLLSMNLSSKKAKFFFKRFLEFEHKHGDANTIQHVKELALRYVENH